MPKWIYATDLDGTLIFSDRSYKFDKRQAVPVDKSEKVTSYMSTAVYNRLKHLADVKFVPVTARTIQQFKRIELPVIPTWAITTCGGIILRDGEVFAPYEQYLSQQDFSQPMKKMQSDLESLDGGSGEVKLIDNKYLYTKAVDRLLVSRQLDRLRKQNPLMQIGLDRSKLYALPLSFNKGKAIKWLQNYIGCPNLVASGDSYFDVDLLNAADIAVIPGHASLTRTDVHRYVEVDAGITGPLQTLGLLQTL